MKLAIIAISLALSTATASAQYGYGTGSRSGGLYGTGSNPSNTYVQPRMNSNGTFTQGHYRTTPNNTQLDNYGTKGNYNPHTGATGNRWGRY